MKQKYSVCISNYNMETTLEESLTSILEQLDDRFEVFVVDDGSSDRSVHILEDLSSKYKQLRYHCLDRDPERRLGLTRNISIEKANGEYVLLHVDTDDLWEPFIMDAVEVFHKLESCVGRDFYLSAQQLHIGKRSFLLKHGPFRNIYHAEDRDMWFRFAANNDILYLKHKVFRKRMVLPRKVQHLKTVNVAWNHMQYELWSSPPKKRLSYIYQVLSQVVRPINDFSVPFRLLRAIMLPGVILFTKSDITPVNITPSEYKKYREKNSGTYSELMKSYGGDPSLLFLSEKAQKIFSSNGKIV